MSEVDMNKLKACPFCGKKVAEVTDWKECDGCDRNDDCLGYKPGGGCEGKCVICSFLEGGCGAKTGWADTVEDAVKAWNRRAGG